MPLTKLQIAPGMDKQNTEYGAEGKWVDGDNIRFRYGLPEKIGGWAKVTSDALVGATRAILTWTDLSGVKYAMYGTNKKLYAYNLKHFNYQMDKKKMHGQIRSRFSTKFLKQNRDWLN